MFSISGLSRQARGTDGVICPPACPCDFRSALSKNNACVPAIPVNEIHSFVNKRTTLLRKLI